MPPAIPILDIAPFLDDEGTPAAAHFVEELRHACHVVGFAHLVGHGIPQELVDEVNDAARRFFDLPEGQRLEIANTNSPHFRGYTRLGMESTNGVSDLRDQIDIGPESTPPTIGPDDPDWLWLRGPNQWPTAVPDLEPAVMAWLERMEQLGTTVMRALAVGLGQPADVFESATKPDPESLIKIIRYPSAEGPGPGQGVGPHHDAGLITFISQDETGGLEVEYEGAFVPVSPMPEAYVLNLGEMLQLATSGFLKATTHQVISPASGAERISLAYFHHPRLEAILGEIELPAELAPEAAGAANADPSDLIFNRFGENFFKFRLRSHLDVAERHHPQLL